MRKLICLFLILAATAICFGQKSFEVRDFSKDYYAKVYAAKQSESSGSGWVAIYDKKTGRQLLKTESYGLNVNDDESGKRPYNEQSVVIYDDFNFDGIKDFALMDGQNSCYGEASFKIYLAGKAKGTFALSQAFTRLAQDYCGMFDIDAQKKRISTTLKSGIGQHQFSEFIVVNNAPKAVKIVDERWDYPFNTTSTEIWDGKKMVKNVLRTPAFQDGDVKILLSFKTAKDENEIVLYRDKDELNYMFVSKSGNVSFAYPFDAGQEKARFTLDSKENPTQLSFIHKGVGYKVYETPDGKFGVEVNANGKSTDILGAVDSRKGGLRLLTGEQLSNLTTK